MMRTHAQRGGGDPEQLDGVQRLRSLLGLFLGHDGSDFGGGRGPNLRQEQMHDVFVEQTDAIPFWKCRRSGRCYDFNLKFGGKGRRGKTT